MNKEDIIEKTKNYVKNICSNDSTGHDWWHIKRVYNTAMLINKEEEADEFVITMIVLLHDLYDHKFYQGDIKEALNGTLKKLDIIEYISEEDISNIVESCVNLGFSSNMAEKKELSREGKITQDADRLDASGAVGIARAFAYGGKKGQLIYDPNNNETVDDKEYFEKGSRTSISHFYDKMLKLKDLMNTKPAKEIAMQRHKFVENYLNEFYSEWNGQK